MRASRVFPGDVYSFAVILVDLFDLERKREWVYAGAGRRPRRRHELDEDVRKAYRPSALAGQCWTAASEQRLSFVELLEALHEKHEYALKRADMAKSECPSIRLREWLEHGVLFDVAGNSEHRHS
jgi:hypothetical protein